MILSRVNFEYQRLTPLAHVVYIIKKPVLQSMNINDELSTLQVSGVIAALQAGAVGTQACNEAIQAIQSIVGDLETTAMFCTAGALNPEDSTSK